MVRLHFYRDICEIPLDQKEFNRVMGFEDELPAPFMEAFQKVSTALATGTARAQIVIFDSSEVTITPNQLIIQGMALQIGKKLISYLKDCHRAALFICTLGTAFEHRMKSFQSDPVEAYFADAIGSLQCEAFADRVHQQIVGHVAKEGLTATNRYSPGYCHWDVSEQQKLFSFFANTPTGITLNASSLMSPIKSISGLVGIGNGVKNTPYLCDICKDTHCIYRKNATIYSHQF